MTWCTKIIQKHSNFSDTSLYKQFKSPLEINEFDLVGTEYYSISITEFNPVFNKYFIREPTDGEHDRIKGVPLIFSHLKIYNLISWLFITRPLSVTNKWSWRLIVKVVLLFPMINEFKWHKWNFIAVRCHLSVTKDIMDANSGNRSFSFTSYCNFESSH